jgi:8-oxo-dGTP pyrophosphatase MutT (NUDIX family)
LLVKRTDDGRWCLPCGWVEPNEAPEETVVRETREEVGLDVRVCSLTGVFTRRANGGHGPHSAIAVGYLCEVIGGHIRLSHEVSESRYRGIDDVADWHEKHLEYALAARAAWQRSAHGEVGGVPAADRRGDGGGAR